jgi:regulator of replication initiation timing
LEAGVQNLNQLQQSREELASIKAQLAELQKANETLTADNAKLQESLDAAIARANANADEDDLKVRKNAVATEDEFKGAQTYEEADAICRDFLKNRI